MDTKRLAISNSQRVVKAFREILLDPSTRPEASNNVVPDLPELEAFDNAVSNLPRPEASNNAVLNFSAPDSSSFILKGLFGNNTRLSNSQKKKPLNKYWFVA